MSADDRDADAGAPERIVALADVAQLLAVALEAFDGRLKSRWSDALRPLLLAPGATTTAAQRIARRRTRLAAFSCVCGPMPLLSAWGTPSGRWALMQPAAMLSRLCALAIALRPGVMRACVRRPAREALADALGPAFEPLNARALRGAAVPAPQAARGPVDWAWVGLRDVSRAGLWPSRSVRRWVLLSMPLRASAGPCPPRPSREQVVLAMTEVDVWFKDSQPAQAI